MVNKNWSDVRTTTPEGELKNSVPADEPEPINEISDETRERITKFVNEEMTMKRNPNESSFPSSKILLEYGIYYINSGTFRNVFGFYPDSEIGLENPTEIVLKVPNTKGTKWANEEEVKVWETLKDTEISEHLAKIHGFHEDFNWILMEKVEEDRNPENEEWKKIRNECADAGWEYRDWKKANTGYANRENGEKVVLMDYGYDNDIMEELK